MPNRWTSARSTRIGGSVPRTLFVLLLLALGPSLAQAFQLAYTAPTTNTDGTPLTDLAGYTLYYRPPGTTTWQAKGDIAATATTVTVELVLIGEWMVTAYNAAGAESDPSNIVMVKKPGKVTITGVTR